jgi:hypothetical protein
MNCDVDLVGQISTCPAPDQSPKKVTPTWAARGWPTFEPPRAMSANSNNGQDTKLSQQNFGSEQY